MTNEAWSQLTYRPFPAFTDWAPRGFDSRVVDRSAELLATAKSTATEEDLARAVSVATRSAAVDTGAIEGLYTVDRGFTKTIATQGAAWQNALAARGETVRRAIEDALNAYDYVLDATTSAVAISEKWIRELHAVICASQGTYTVHTQHGTEQRPLPKGTYKTMPNSPTNLSTGAVHSYASVADTGPEMARLMQELGSRDFMAAHPVIQAAYAHYAFVCVHPFTDGNGRVARALASVYLYRSPGVPLVIYADQRSDYLDALEAADAGDSAPFTTFVEQRTIDTIGMVRVSLRRVPPARESVESIAEQFSKESLDPALVVAIERLKGILRNEYKKQLAGLGLPPQLEVDPVQGRRGGDEPPPAGYAEVGAAGDLYLWARASWPVRFSVTRGLRILARADELAPADILIYPEEGEPLEIWLREISPILTESLKQRLNAWVEGHIDTFMQTVAATTQQAPRVE